MSEFLTLSIITCGFLMALIGSLALKQNPRKRSNQLFFAASFLSILWMSTLYLGFHYTHPETQALSNTFFRLSHGAGIAAITAMTGFIVCYPKKTLKLPFWFNNSYFFFSGILAIIAAFTPWVYESVVLHADGHLSDILGPIYGLFIFHTLGSQIFSIIISLKKIKKCQGITCRKLKLILFGFTSFAVCAFITNGILPVFEIYILQREAPLFALLFLIPAFSALYKHRFFHFSYHSLNLTRYSLLTLSFLSVYAASNVLLKQIAPILPISIILAFSGLLGLSTYLLLSKRFPELVSETYQHTRKTLINLQKNLYHCDQYEQLEKQLHKQLSVTLNLQNPQLWMIRKNKRRSDIPIYTENQLTNYFCNNHQAILVREELEYKKDEHSQNKILLQKLQTLHAQLCFPLYAEQQLIGLFTLGNKGDGSFYGEEELNLFQKLIPHLETCFMNILLESGLRKEHSLVEQSLQKRTKSIKDQVKKSKELLQQHKEQLSFAAHELKNPLHTLMMQLEVSLAEIEENTQTSEDLKIMEASVERLHQLTMNLFEAEQYDRNTTTLNLQKSPLSEIINETYFEFQPLMKEKQIIFTLDNRVPKTRLISIDDMKIRQVLQNLLHNAYKFTGKNGKIGLSLHESSLTIQIKISDTGVGIEREQKKTIFEKFQHGQKNHGLGIGLFLSKKIIDLHGGSLEVQDNPSGGSIFIVTLRKKRGIKTKSINSMITLKNM